MMHYTAQPPLSASLFDRVGGFFFVASHGRHKGPRGHAALPTGTGPQRRRLTRRRGEAVAARNRHSHLASFFSRTALIAALASYSHPSFIHSLTEIAVYHIVKRANEHHIEISSPSLFADIVLSGTMFLDHMPYEYQDNFLNVHCLLPLRVFESSAPSPPPDLDYRY